VEGIVKHDYYRASTFERRRSEMNGRVQLEQVANWIDAEENLRDEHRKAILKRKKTRRTSE
jgi:hypothetical protein